MEAVRPLIYNQAQDGNSKKSSKKEGTLELGSPIINIATEDFEDRYNSIVSKNSIIEHVASPSTFIKDEF